MFIPDSRLHKFAHFKGLRLFFLSNFSEAMFIQGATSIPDSRVSALHCVVTFNKFLFVGTDDC